MIGLRFFPLKSADVRGAGTRDEPLRTSAWEATRSSAGQKKERQALRELRSNSEIIIKKERHRGLDVYRVIKISCVRQVERDSLLRSISCGFESMKK